MSDKRPDDAAPGTAVDVAAIRDRWAEWFGVTVYQDKHALRVRSSSPPDAWLGDFRLSNWAETFSHAPSDVKMLLAEVARLRAALEAGRGG